MSEDTGKHAGHARRAQHTGPGDDGRNTAEDRMRAHGATPGASMEQPERLRETFHSPDAAADRLAALASEERLAGPAMLRAVPASATIEAAFPPRALRGMLWGAGIGLVTGVALGIWAAGSLLLTGSWGGLVSGGAPALGAALGLALAGVGALIGGVFGLTDVDPHIGEVPRATLTAEVKAPETSGDGNVERHGA